MEVGIALSDLDSPGPFKGKVIGQAGRVPCEADNWWISVSHMRMCPAKRLGETAPAIGIETGAGFPSQFRQRRDNGGGNDSLSWMA